MREFRLVVDALDASRIEQIEQLLEIDLGREAVEVDPKNGLVYCYVDGRKAVKGTRFYIMAILARYNLAEEIVAPIGAERWDARRHSYVGMTREDRREVVQASSRVRRPLTDVTWVVTVEPAGVFEWRNLRHELARRGRRILAERQGSLDVPALDEADARQLIEELERLECVRGASTRRLGWFERWRRREQLFGNYASEGGSGPYSGI